MAVFPNCTFGASALVLRGKKHVTMLTWRQCRAALALSLAAVRGPCQHCCTCGALSGQEGASELGRCRTGTCKRTGGVRDKALPVFGTSLSHLM